MPCVPHLPGGFVTFQHQVMRENKGNHRQSCMDTDCQGTFRGWEYSQLLGSFSLLCASKEKCLLSVKFSLYPVDPSTSRYIDVKKLYRSSKTCVTHSSFPSFSLVITQIKSLTAWCTFFVAWFLWRKFSCKKPPCWSSSLCVSLHLKLSLPHCQVAQPLFLPSFVIYVFLHRSGMAGHA